MKRQSLSLWHIKWGHNGENSIQKKALRYLAAFLLLMVLCTLLSGAADALTLAKIKTEALRPMSLKHDTSLNGTLTPKYEQAVFTLPDQRVSSVQVKEGDMVKEGDVLFQVDLEVLEEQLEKARDELKKSEYQQKDTNSANALEAKERQKAEARAREDYDRAVDESDRKIQEAEVSWADAQARLEIVRDRPVTTEPDGDTGQGYTQEQKQEEISALEQETAARKQAYDAAVAEKEERVRNALRQVEDSSAPPPSNHSNAIADLDQKEITRRIQKLEQLKADGGMVRATMDGVVKKLEAAIGQITPSTMAALLTDTSNGYRFEATASKEEIKYLAVGDEVTLDFGDHNDPISGLGIESIEVSEEDPDLSLITLDVPPQKERLPSAAELKGTQTTEKYPAVVPIEALKVENGKYFLYMPAVKESVLGNIMVVERVDVDVLDKNDKYAAVGGAFLESNEVLVHSSKPVGTGDRVRKEEG